MWYIYSSTKKSPFVLSFHSFHLLNNLKTMLFNLLIFYQIFINFYQFSYKLLLKFIKNYHKKYQISTIKSILITLNYSPFLFYFLSLVHLLITPLTSTPPPYFTFLYNHKSQQNILFFKRFKLLKMRQIFTVVLR